MMNKRKATMWGALGGSLLALQLHGVHTNDGNGNGDGDTVSEFTRLIFRTETTAGKVAFVVAYAAFTCVWVPHVLDETKQRNWNARHHSVQH